MTFLSISSMMMFRRTIPLVLSLALGIGAGFFVFLETAPVSLAAFKDPEAAPPAKNVAEPINVGSTPQARLGPLRLGDALQSGFDPTLTLQVKGSGNNANVAYSLTVTGDLKVGQAFPGSSTPLLTVSASNDQVVLTRVTTDVDSLLNLKLKIFPGSVPAIVAESSGSGSAIVAKFTNTGAGNHSAISAASGSGSADPAVSGQNTAATAGVPGGENLGVYGFNTAGGIGVYGQTAGGFVTSFGVAGYASTSSSDIGVLGVSEAADGLAGVQGNGAIVGVQGTATSSTASLVAGVYGQKPQSGSSRYGLYAEGPALAYDQPDRYAGYFAGPVLSTQEVIAKRFYPSQLPPSLVPYTAGQKVLEVTTGGTPRGAAFDGTYVWVAKDAGASSAVLKIRASDGVAVGTFTHAEMDKPLPVLFDGASIWVADNSPAVSGNSNLFKINPSDASPQKNCEIGGTPQALAFDGSSIWVSKSGSSPGLTKVDPATCTVVTNYSIGTNDARGVVFDGTYLWVAARDHDSVIRFHPGSSACEYYSVVPGVPGGLCPSGGTSNYRPNSVAFDGSYLWVGSEGNGGGVSTRLSKLATDGSLTPPLLKQYTSAQLNGLNGIDGLFFDGVHLWTIGAAGDSSQPSANGYLLQIGVSDGTLLANFDYSGSFGLAFDGSFLWSSQGTLGKVYKVFTGQGFGQADLRSVLQLQSTTPGTAQAGNANITGTLTVGGNAQVVEVSAPNNVWGGLDDPRAVTGIGNETSCQDGWFVSQILTDTATGKVTSIICRQL